MAEELTNGVIVPQGKDPISSIGVAEMRTLGSSVDKQLGRRIQASALAPTDLNTVKTPGSYRMSAPYPTGYSNVPDDNITASMLTVIAGPSPSTWAAQEVYQYGATPRRWWRISRTQTAWNDWIELTAGGGTEVPTNALTLGARDLRVGMFEDAYSLVSTGGKGVVCFRYDHGLTNFKSTLLPVHEKYGIVPYIAMNSRNWDLEQNSGATQEEAKTWNVEWGNHTADHKDKTGVADIYDTILNGRIELEQQLGRTIHGFTVPGVTEYQKFDGFGTGSATGYSNSYAGSLIMSAHAVCSGTIGPTYRPLDGNLAIGTRHWTWESSSWDTIKAKIDQAVTTKTALTLMCHPSTMGASSSYWDAALAEQVVSYVRDLIDAGQLADISYYQSHRAVLGAVPQSVDTGWRDLTAELRYGWTGEVMMRRVRDKAQIAFRNLSGSAATNQAVVPLWLGFRPYTFGGVYAQTFQELLMRGQPADRWVNVGNGFVRVGDDYTGWSTSNMWQVLEYPAQQELPDMADLPGVPLNDVSRFPILGEGQ